MAALGIQTDRYGKLVFDEATFDKAYAADPAADRRQVHHGSHTADGRLAARVAHVAKAASDPTTGTVTAAITGRNSTIDRLDDSIDGLGPPAGAAADHACTRQFTALETALSNMQSQGNWLAGQIASLTHSLDRDHGRDTDDAQSPRHLPRRLGRPPPARRSCW